VRLLLDENLSHRLLAALAASFPGSCHVRDVGLASAEDVAIWSYARANGFAIVTLDSDFYDLSLVHGWPPKVVWLRTFDTSTSAVQAMLETQADTIIAFLTDRENAAMMVTR
jgi:predicted nuclease of predicted toxin-antitoxin system